jgi:hypothetical protein
MHFGEYELSPSLIGLSPLPTVIRRLFNATGSVLHSVLPSFNLPMGRSQGFASTPTDYIALFRLAFASAPILKSDLTLPVTSNS